MKAVNSVLAGFVVSCLFSVATSAGSLPPMAVPAVRQAAAARTPDATNLLNWAERTYPTLFPGPQSNQTVDIWTLRYYPKTDSYLGVNTSSDVGWLQGNGGGSYKYTPLGKIADFGCYVYPQDCVPEPKSSGDIVGRDLSIPLLDWAGHIGIYDGANVIEVLNEGGNVVRINSYDNFKNRSQPWNPVYTKFSENHSIKSCWGSTCDLAKRSSSYVGLAARYAVAQRAYQAYLIGADYTLTAYSKEAEPKYLDGTDPYWSGRPSIRGLYRCDTFVIDAFYATTMYGNGANNGRTITGSPYGWADKVVGLKFGHIIPTVILEKLRNF